MDPIFLKGVLAFIGAVVVFIGSIWMLLSMVLGWRMGYLVTASTLFGLLTILGIMWFGNALGPKGLETHWVAIGAGPDLAEIEGHGASYDLSDYPQGEWEDPEEGRQLADLRRGQDTLSEVPNMTPVMESLVSQAVSPIPGRRSQVAGQVQGEIRLQSGEFSITDVKVKEADVEDKPSLIAVGRAVPSDTIRAGPIDGFAEAKVVEYLASPGDQLSPGAPVLTAEAEDGTRITVVSSGSGRMIKAGLRPGDVMREGIPIAIADLSGQPGQPDPAEVAAVRVRGAVRSPALRYLLAFAVLFAVHLGLLNRAERVRRALPQPA